MGHSDLAASVNLRHPPGLSNFQSNDHHLGYSLADLNVTIQPITETPSQVCFHRCAPFGYMPQNANKLEGDEDRQREAYHNTNPAAMKRMSRD
jgi:hypothetical protein